MAGEKVLHEFNHVRGQFEVVEGERSLELKQAQGQPVDLHHGLGERILLNEVMRLTAALAEAEELAEGAKARCLDLSSRLAEAEERQQDSMKRLVVRNAELSAKATEAEEWARRARVEGMREIFKAWETAPTLEEAERTIVRLMADAERGLVSLPDSEAMA